MIKMSEVTVMAILRNVYALGSSQPPIQVKVRIPYESADHVGWGVGNVDSRSGFNGRMVKPIFKKLNMTTAKANPQ